MNTDTLSLEQRISELIEPRSTFNDDAAAHNYIVIEKFLSVGKAWVFHPGRTYADPQPVEWTRSEDASARLLDVLIQNLGALDAWYMALMRWASEDWRYRKTAIALAFIAYFEGLSAEAREQCRKDLASGC